MKNENGYFQVLHKIYSNPELGQIKLAYDLEISLGKVNYCFKKLKKKSLKKIQKNAYLYIFNSKDISTKTKLTLKFIKKISRI